MVNFRDAAARRGQTFGVVLLPIHGGPNRQVASILEQLGIPVLDLYESFYPSPPVDPEQRASYFFRSDGHWNAAGNRRAASILAARILKDLGQPAVHGEVLERWLDVYTAAMAGGGGSTGLEIRRRFLEIQPAEPLGFVTK